MISFTSRSNPKIKLIRSLRQRKRRDEAGLFLVEGIRHIGEAVDAGAAVQAICYAPDLLTSEYALGLIQQQGALHVPCLAVDADTFRTLADKENPQGILAVVRKPDFRLEEFNPGNFSWGVALVSPQDPGNIGTILRTIDAVGANGLLLLEDCADPFHPSAVRASMGAIFGHPVVSASFVDFLEWAHGHQYHLYGTSSHGSDDVNLVQRYKRPLILLLGSEREGLTPQQATACELLIRLPMRGRVTSLNLAVAAGVMLYAMLEKL